MTKSARLPVWLLACITALGSLTACKSTPEIQYLGEAVANSDREEPANVTDVLALLDDDTVFAVRNDGEARLWDRQGEALELEQTLAVSLTSAVLLRADDGVVVRHANAEEVEMPTKSPIGAGALSSNGSTVALVDRIARTIELMSSAETDMVERVHTESYEIRSIALSGNGQRVAAATGVYDDESGHRTQIEVWDTTTGKRIFSVSSSGTTNHGVWRVALSHDGSMLAADRQTDGKGGFTIWSLPDGKEVLRRESPESYWARGLALSADGKMVACGDEKGNLNIWRIADGKHLLERPMRQPINAVALSRDGARLGAALWDSTIALLPVTQ